MDKAPGRRHAAEDLAMAKIPSRGQAAQAKMEADLAAPDLAAPEGEAARPQGMEETT